MEIINLGVDFVTSSLAYVGYLFTDIKSVIYLVVGLPVGFWIFGKVIGLVTKRLGRA